MWEDLSEEITQVSLGSFFGHTDGTRHHSFLTTSVITDCMVLFLKCGLRQGGILIHCFIIAKDIGGAVDWDAEHAQFIAQGLNQFDCNLHGLEFAAEGASLHSRLFLAMPQDRGSVIEYQYARL